MDLAGLTWSEAGERAEGGALLAVPLGATEQHGPHLPLSTDTDVAVEMCRRLAAARGDVLVAPPLGYGASGEHQDFPGTLSIGKEALTTLLVELGRSAGESFTRMVVVNAHGGNVGAVKRAVAKLHDESRAVLAWVPRAYRDAHAGHSETAVQLALDPERVRADRAQPGATAPVAELMPQLRAHGVRGVSPNGVLGDPTGATAEEGERLLTELAVDLIGEVAHWAGPPPGS
jgi:mycofactocin precursor peptide peptidase